MHSGYTYLNFRKNGEIQGNMKLMNDKREQFENTVSRKRDKVLKKLEDLDIHKKHTFDQIDNFFQQLIEKAKARTKQLKEQFDEIELKERQRLEQIQEKISNDAQQLKLFSQGFLNFYYNFDDQADFNSNKATYSRFLRDLEKIKESQVRKTYYYKIPKHQKSEFKFIDTDLKLIDNMGKIQDNSHSQAPLVVFNTQNFGIFEFKQKLQSFTTMMTIDEENLAEKMPKNFKSVFIGNESFILAGGFDEKQAKSSKRVYFIQRGRIQELMEMYKGRQYFPMVTDYATRYVYCIGGFSMRKGALDHVERYSIEKKEWEQVANLNNRRINCGACTIGKNHIFVFGGRSEGDTFYDTVERFNIELNLWNLLKIQLPKKLCNVFAFTFNEQNIIILGGLRKFSAGVGGGVDRESLVKKNGDKNQTKMPEYEIERNVYLYNQVKEVWYQLKPLPTNLKVCNIVHNGNGKFYLFLLDNKQELPSMMMYDLRVMCPRLDRYWYHEHVKKITEAKKNQQTLDFFINDSRRGPKRQYEKDPYSKAMDITQKQPLPPMPTDLIPKQGEEGALVAKGSIATNNQLRTASSQKKEPQVFELKVLKDFGLSEKQLEEDINPGLGMLNVRDRRDFNNFDDDLDMLKLDEGFSQINQSALMSAMQNAQYQNFPLQPAQRQQTQWGYPLGQGGQMQQQNMSGGYPQLRQQVSNQSNNRNLFDDSMGEDLPIYTNRRGNPTMQELGTPLGSFKNSNSGLFSDENF